MSTQLDILALEPFFGGPRKAMLETIMRYSRHRWTLLRLPPRRIERRLMAAAHWFAEQLSRHWVGRVDVLFTSEAMNLADLLRLVPELGPKPSVVYFHDNQLPQVGQDADAAHHVVNLGTAGSASEIWFNSVYHLKMFLTRASAMVERHPELSGRNPLPAIAGKSHLMPPPVDFSQDEELGRREKIARNPRLLFVDTRDADIALLNQGLLGLSRRERYGLVTVGPVEGLSDDLERTTISERDEAAQARALHQAGVLVSARPDAASDHYAVRALHAGCWPVFPASGVYPELLPELLHPFCLYDSRAVDRLVNQIQNTWCVQQPYRYEEAIAQTLAKYDALEACQAMDQRLEELAISHSGRSR